MLGLAGLMALGPIASSTATAGNINSETRIESREGTNSQFMKTRTKLSQGPFTLTYDLNHRSDKPNEVKLWADAVSGRKFSLGVLAEGANRANDSEGRYADIGVSPSVISGSKKYDGFVGYTVQDGVKPVGFYQLAARDTSGNANLVLSLFDNREVPLSFNNLNVSPYFSIAQGNVFAGVGITQKGLEKKTAKHYGAFGYKDGKFGTFTVYKHNPQTQEGKVKIQNAYGNPTGFFDISNVNLWNDIEGPGMRQVSEPYFSSPITKGDFTFGAELNYTPKVHDYEFIAGRNLGFAKVGAGVNYHREYGKGNFNGLIHVGKDVKINRVGKLGIDVRYNTRGSFAKTQVNFQRSF